MTALAMTLSAEPGVSLAGLVRALAPFQPVLRGDASVAVTGVRQDSRQVEPGELFVARPGGRVSGADFAAQAVARGAAAVLAEPGAVPVSVGVPVLEVSDVKRALGVAAETVYRNPSRALSLVGIAGTNGKT